MKSESGNRAYAAARERYGEVGIDTASALERLASVSISLHCWQGDDVGGFEPAGTRLGGGLAATGNYPGKARTAAELRSDADKALGFIPGRHRFNLHASYGEFGGKDVDRDAIGPEHFKAWIDWARDRRIGLDFNPTFFSHPRAADNFTLSHRDKAVRDFWINHGIASRRIGAAFGRALATPCVTNLWIPDGMKDTPVDRAGPRQRLLESLDAIYRETLDAAVIRDAVEGKLFGIGCESYTVGSHEFYLGYAVTRRKMLTLDTGHYHPTESVADKISSVPGLPSGDPAARQPRRSLGQRPRRRAQRRVGSAVTGAVRGGFLERTHIGLDYFDASINRVAAWTIGARNTLKAMLRALLEPTQTLRALEEAGDFTARLALLEELKLLPMGAVWDYYCESAGVPVGTAWLDEIKVYERDVLSART